MSKFVKVAYQVNKPIYLTCSVPITLTKASNNLASQTFISQKFCTWTWQHRKSLLQVSHSKPALFPSHSWFHHTPQEAYHVYTCRHTILHNQAAPLCPMNSHLLATLERMDLGQRYGQAMEVGSGWLGQAPEGECTKPLTAGRVHWSTKVEPQQDLSKQLLGMSTSSLCLFPF